MKPYSISRLAMAFAALATASAARAATLPTDTIGPAVLTRQSVVVVHDTVFRYVAVPVHIGKDAAETDGLAQTKYEKLRTKRMKHWMKLIPNQFTIQYAGSIGLLNAGPGWHYGRKDNWETDILFGFLPRYHSEHAKFTFTVKERYVPWHCRLGKAWGLQPLTAGIGFNTLSGSDFWNNLPDKYPHNYYWFSTKLRTHVFIGQRIRYDIPQHYRRRHSSVSAYYEISSCDFYLLSKYSNREYAWHDVISLAFGIRWEM